MMVQWAACPITLYCILYRFIQNENSILGDVWFAVIVTGGKSVIISADFIAVQLGIEDQFLQFVCVLNCLHPLPSRTEGSMLFILFLKSKNRKCCYKGVHSPR